MMIGEAFFNYKEKNRIYRLQNVMSGSFYKAAIEIGKVILFLLIFMYFIHFELHYIINYCN